MDIIESNSDGFIISFILSGGRKGKGKGVGASFELELENLGS